ncbi:hypothetical protein GCM10023196_028610 [Actinoallomurus vinaceus]|uniref:Uncharacterized protein n=1 Tax=Actinoallomurus vinaceus TaxID=1080074 RepID=A0ABP8UAK3_9ACTN
MGKQLTPRANGRTKSPITGLRSWIVLITAGSAGVLTAATSWNPAPAAAAYRAPGPDAAHPAHQNALPHVQPSPSTSAVTDGGGTNVTVGPDRDDDNRRFFDDRFFDDGPFKTRRHLEFTGAIGFPEVAIGCFFDPDSRGADRHGRRVVCVETAGHPPIFAHTRIRGRDFFDGRFRRFRHRNVH